MQQIIEDIEARIDAFTDREVYTSPAVFEEEKKKIFEKVWLLAGHETEVRRRGDFKRITIAGQPLLMARGRDEKVRVFYNSCMHRGSLVEERGQGNCERFQCPFHGWQYSCEGHLTHVPKREGYGDWFKEANYGLVELAKTDFLYGYVFVSFNPEVEPLVEYLSPAKASLEYVCTHDGETLKVVGSYKYDCAANWKLLIDNTVDNYHATHLHAPMLDMTKWEKVFGRSVTLGIHGALEYKEPQARGRRTLTHYLNIFPNALLLYNASADMSAIRLIEPVAVDKMRVGMYLLSRESATSDEDKERARMFAQMWGPGGLFGADDVKQLELVQQGLQAKNGARVLTARGLEEGEEGRPENEQSMRGFRRGWHHCMTPSQRLH